MFGPQVLHDIRSVTKSVTSLLYGIALDRGYVPPPEALLLAQFPEYFELAGEESRARLTVGHALTMTMGAAWDESIPYSDPRNSGIAMENAPDRLHYVLSQKIVSEPGSKWTYCGGAVALLGVLIARGAAMPLEEFARRVLFAPLHIRVFEWLRGRDGTASAASGLRLCARDLLQIGQVILAKGHWEGRQLVTRAWVEASIQPFIPTGDGLEYGRLWFLGDAHVRCLSGKCR